MSTPIIEETARVDRRIVETGAAVRVRKVVSEHEEVVDTTTLHDSYEVERVPVGRLLDAPVGVRQEGDVLIVPVIEERVVVRKEWVLAEELRLVRRKISRPATQTVVLRREEAVVERRDSAADEWRPWNGKDSNGLG